MAILDDHEYLKTYARYLTHDTNRAAELVQDTLIRCWQIHPRCDELPKHEAILFCRRILHNFFIDSIRKKHRDKLVFQPYDMGVTTINFEDAKAIALEAKNKIESILEYVPKAIRVTKTYDAWFMRKFLEYPQKKIAGILGLTQGDIGSKIFRVDKAVKDHFVSLKKEPVLLKKQSSNFTRDKKTDKARLAKLRKLINDERIRLKTLPLNKRNVSMTELDIKVRNYKRKRYRAKKLQ